MRGGVRPESRFRSRRGGWHFGVRLWAQGVDAAAVAASSLRDANNPKPGGRLVGGTALFDISWRGLLPRQGPQRSGPWPAPVILFVPAVLFGMLLHRFTVGRGPVSRKA
ncbi:Hypothetical protein MexAM1_META1p1192 [Methylorubrum extorquens AM1]|uniref:Uncharacterized protein n=1 Tax=Methylorubrum extorquens (strain ATCC 14718 / DSM 1338 / JCM 2805 / NCIMB 9133 / AM1) TaxID=272630 RepID=C5AY07_METEA|nr:Hypothetical protein MexAM1_META1p1192 [Methylorubrum extorquens AM1]